MENDRCVLLGVQTCASCGISSLTRDPCPLAPAPCCRQDLDVLALCLRSTPVHERLRLPLAYTGSVVALSPPPRPPRLMPTHETPPELRLYLEQDKRQHTCKKWALFWTMRRQMREDRAYIYIFIFLLLLSAAFDAPRVSPQRGSVLRIHATQHLAGFWVSHWLLYVDVVHLKPGYLELFYRLLYRPTASLPAVCSTAAHGVHAPIPPSPAVPFWGENRLEFDWFVPTTGVRFALKGSSSVGNQQDKT